MLVPRQALRGFSPITGLPLTASSRFSDTGRSLPALFAASLSNASVTRLGHAVGFDPRRGQRGGRVLSLTQYGSGVLSLTQCGFGGLIFNTKWTWGSIRNMVDSVDVGFYP